MTQRSWNRCLLAAFLLVVLAFAIGLIAVPALLQRPGLSSGPLAICATWFVFLIVYGAVESRRG